MKNICILGSTGSIGTQALDVIRQRNKEFKVSALSANSNVELLYKQAIEFKPEIVDIIDTEGYYYLKDKLSLYGIKVINGIEGLEYISSLDNVDVVLTSVVGMVGLRPTLAAIKAKKTIALANKETLVVGGEIIKKELETSGAKIIPVDSEHCAIHQCLKNENRDYVNKLILTASGGPFRGKRKEELIEVRLEEALKHPRWNMGKKISIDSATLMNKALEVIEAHWLFEMDYNKIDVVVHPQSIIHSMVEYIDGSVIAQLGNTDMRAPIQYALDFPLRNISINGYIDFMKNNTLTFEKPDYETFQCLSLGYEAGRIGGTMPAILNAANEEAVNLFIKGKIKFLDIAEVVKSSMKSQNVEFELTLDKIIEADRKTREFVNLLIR